ncbi:unnamed protein product [Nippostrongylus brasiliensis]|uniref:LCCL domain-containing protein n=1 Tax=Nippostrongylus brasiliensis TaxID=27835 RepID=A0A0N4YQU9_NIPBR|nr:unnamed protein product [Nippostrongylus brasiliensis]
MFTCPGSCGGGYRHGDEISPYPEGATSITARRTSSSSAGVGPPVPTCSPSTSAPGPVSARKSHSSDPHMSDSGCTDGQKKRKTPSTSERWEATNLELILPPGLEEHCPHSSLSDIYGDPSKAPRYGIEELLRSAHCSHLVRDSYNERRRCLSAEGIRYNALMQMCNTNVTFSFAKLCLSGTSMAFPAKPEQWDHTASSSSTASECADDLDNRTLQLSDLNVNRGCMGVVFDNPIAEDVRRSVVDDFKIVIVSEK